MFSINCGCRNAKSVSVFTPRTRGSHRAPAAPEAASARFESSSADTTTLTTATTSTSHDDVEEYEDGGGSPSFSGLLRELSELERSVVAWDRRRRIPPGWDESGEAGETGEEEVGAHRHAPAASAEKAGGGKLGKDGRQWRQKHGRHWRSQSEGGVVVGDVVGRMGGSVVVVTETEDPVGEFRRSMLQMIVEEDIVCPEVLRELVRRFLALNSPTHHALIVRAFADIWRDVFSGHLDDLPDLMAPASSAHPHRRLRRQHSYQGHRGY